MDALIHGVMDWLPGDGGQPYLAPRRPVVDAWATPLRASGLIILDLGTFPRAGEKRARIDLEVECSEGDRPGTMAAVLEAVVRNRDYRLMGKSETLARRYR